MDNNDDPDTPELANASKEITENVAIATTHPQQPSIIFSSKGDSYSSPLHKLQHHISKVLKGLSPSEEVKTRVYNPEILTTQKRQWASFQQSLDHKLAKEPSQLFESIVVVGLHHNVDLQAFKRQLVESDSVGPKKLSNILNHQLDNVAGVNIEPQVLFVYPADKELPLPYKDLVSICLPGGVEVHAIERTPSLSELNEIFLGQERLKKSDLSFVFRLQVADNSTLYGCCVLVEEIVQNPSRLVSILSEKKCLRPFLSRHIITTTRCYCILSRLPFFSLHFGVLKSIFAEERLERLTSSVDILNFFSPEENNMQEESQIVLLNHSTAKGEVVEEACDEPILIPASLDSNESNKQIEELDSEDVIKYNKKSQFDVENGWSFTENKLYNEMQKGHVVEDDMDMESNESKRAAAEAVLPLGQSHQYESFEHFGRKMRINVDDPETEGPFYHQEDSNSHIDILQWAKEKNHGSLQIICEYYRLQCPSRGSKLTFQPLEHLHPLEFYRAHCAHLAEEEVMALSVWTIACVCATLRLENILTMFAAALLEKQIVVVSSNLGILSASVLSAIPLIRPYQWQSLLMPVLPNDMLDFLDAPVPYIVGIKEISAEVQLKIMNSVIVDANRNTVRSPLMPQLPQYKELLTSLNPYYTKLVGESYLARKRPVYECTDVQVEAAGGFLAVIGSYLDSLCSNLRAHTITNVQSNRDKVSLLLKESFIDSFPNCDRPFIKLFVDTQLFSVHTDFILSLYQKD